MLRFLLYAGSDFHVLKHAFLERLSSHAAIALWEIPKTRIIWTTLNIDVFLVYSAFALAALVCTTFLIFQGNRLSLH